MLAPRASKLLRPLLSLFFIALVCDASRASAAPDGWRSVGDLVVSHYRMHEADPGPILHLDDPSAFLFLDFTRRSSWTPRTESRQHGMSTLVRGRSATLRIPALEGDCAKGCVLRAAMFSAPATNRVRPVLNGTPLGEALVGDRWTLVELAVPAGMLRDGENELELKFDRSARFAKGRHAAGLRFVRFDAPDRAWTRLRLPKRFAEMQVADGAARVLPARARQSWYVSLPAAGRLRLEVVANPRTRCALQVVATDVITGTTTEIVSETSLAEDHQTTLVGELGEAAGRPVRLDLRWSGTGRCGLAAAHIEVPSSVGVERVAPAPLARGVVVWAVDAVRADQLRVYAPDSPVQTPALDAFARVGVVFRPALAAGAHSLPSHASLLLSQQPATHRVVIGDDRISGSDVLVSELLSAADVRTGLISANGYVSDKWGFQQGWDFYTNTLREGRGASCEKLLELAETFLTETGDRRFFLYLVPVEPHVPYRYREGLTERYDIGGRYSGRYRRSVTGGELGKIRGGRAVSARDQDRIRALYRGEITHSDTCFATLLDLLQRYRRTGDTAVVVLSDHGEELFDRGGVGHAHSVHQEIVDVPFIVRLPFSEAACTQTAPRYRAEGAGHADLGPTVLDLLGVDVGEAPFQGESLLPLLTDPTPALPRALFANHGAARRALQVGSLKHIVHMDGREEVFDQAGDPGEKHDILTERPHATRLMRDVLALYKPNERRWRGATWGNAALPSATYSEWLRRGWLTWKERKIEEEKRAPR